MNDLKMQLQKRLVANVIIDKCSANDNIIFNEAWCTQDRVIRFTTPFFRKMFQTTENTTGYWKTGDAVMYEVYISPDSFSIACLISDIGITKENKELFNSLSKYDSFTNEQSRLFSLKKWEYKPEEKLENIFERFDSFIEVELKTFENDISNFLKNAKEDPVYLEGEHDTFAGSKYERNPKARAACLAYHGTACVICGIDFEKAYGPEFAGKIEVHHIVPLNQIGNEYIVDPIHDLVPVCPNCHTAIHSKKDGVYTIDEMKKMVN